MAQLLGPKSLRALKYVHVLNNQGLRPSAEQLRAFIDARSELHAYSYDPWLDDFRYRPIDEFLVDAQLLLLDERRGLLISPSGSAILSEAERSDEEGPTAHALEVVGRMEDPFTYAQLLTRIDEMESTLVVDPYLPPDDLFTLLRLPGVERVLTKETQIRGLSKAERTHRLAIALGARQEVELRFVASGSGELHDRLVIPSTGDALIMGTSLGGTQLTVVTRVGAETTAVLRAHYEQVWRTGSPVDPVARPADH